MGEVYLAEDTRIARQIAIKVVRRERTPYPNANSEQEATRLFQREMKVVAQLDHTHILSFYDFGEEPFVGGTIMYMVMPYRSEGSLSDWLMKHGKANLLSPREISNLLIQAASALQCAHDHNIIHQDVKPSNFLVRVRKEQPTPPELFLVDFGVAKILNATTTVSNNVRGTYAYMAPEQWSGEVVPATDQYALAVMAYQLLTGNSLFQGRPEQIMYQHLKVVPTPPSSINVNLSPAIDTIILRALAKEPQERFPSITAFATAFQQATSYTDLHTTLSLTRSEAFTGTSKTIRLPENRQVTVTVPPNAQNGQQLHLPEQGNSYYDDGPRGPLLLTISTAQTEVIPIIADTEVDTTAETTPDTSPDVTEDEVLSGELSFPAPDTNDPTILASPVSLEPYETTIFAKAASSAPNPFPKPAKRPSKQRVLILLAAALLIIISSIIAFTTIHTIQVHNHNATTTAQNIADNNATSTAQAIADDNATATALAIQATAQAQAQATAQIIAANPDPYSPTGKLALIDPLSQQLVWRAYSNTSFGGQCQFTNGAYQVSQSPPSKFFYCDTSDTYSNFAFEVQMTILQGDCGGLIIRNNDSSGDDYALEVCSDDTYNFYKYTGYSGSDSTTLIYGTSQLNSGTNTIAIVANGSNFTLYINGQNINSTSDSSFSQGTIGLVASTNQNTTVVQYKNARVWTF